MILPLIGAGVATSALIYLALSSSGKNVVMWYDGFGRARPRTGEPSGPPRALLRTPCGQPRCPSSQGKTSRPSSEASPERSACLSW